MVSSLNELKDVLPNFDESIFKTHVNKNKNDLADWAGKNIDPKLGDKMKSARDKASIIKVIDEFIKGRGDGNKKKEQGEKEEGKDELGKDISMTSIFEMISKENLLNLEKKRGFMRNLKKEKEKKWK